VGDFCRKWPIQISEAQLYNSLIDLDLFVHGSNLGAKMKTLTLASLTFVVVSLLILISISSDSVQASSLQFTQWGEVTSATNIVFVKPAKVGGSTVAGVVRRISAKRNILDFDKQLDLKTMTKVLCQRKKHFGRVVANHHTRTDLQNALHACDKNRVQMFLLSWVREPLERCLSQYYHIYVSRMKEPPSLESKLEYCGGDGRFDDHFEEYLSLHDPQESAETTIRQFDYVGISNRFDESMLVLKHLLGLSYSEILYLSAKNSSNPIPSGKQDILKHNSIHRHLPLSEEPTEVQHLLSSEAWKEHNRFSLNFFTLANEKLDEHIAAIGNDVFAIKLAEYRSLLAKAHAECGTLSDPVHMECYLNDHGCGYKCLDAVAEKF